MRRRQLVYISVTAAFVLVIAAAFLGRPGSHLKVEGTLTPDDVRDLRRSARQERSRIVGGFAKSRLGGFRVWSRNIFGWKLASIELVSGTRNPEGKAYVQYGDIFDRRRCYVIYFIQNDATGWHFDSARDYRR
jgi:hypothetical protein